MIKRVFPEFDEFYIDPLLKLELELLVNRQQKNFDNVIIVDGMEGSGKSTFAIGLAYYLAKRTNVSFTHENVFFEAEKMRQFIQETRRQVIVYDEAALQLQAVDWQAQQQQIMKEL